MAKKLFVKTHGCQMNEYDSARMLDVLKDAQGYEMAATEEEADVLLLDSRKSPRKGLSPAGPMAEAETVAP